ncbi:MAG: RdgB/HAM1 family non-canonical purine NTP pyrophosphatase [Patescibacteria group bacterium]|jgi:XTP/dITP diphosphohydrolase
MKIIFATTNQGKIKEIKAILKDLEIEVLSIEQAGITEEIEEDGQTLTENSLKKAREVSKKTGEWALADDSGIFIEALAGKPGIMSARWAGKKAKAEKIIEFTLKKMKDVPLGQRQAYFETIAALVAPDGRTWTFEGKINGQITLEPKGTPRKNLPYDLIFIPQGLNKTFAEIPVEQKNLLSHRAQAFVKLKKFLREKQYESR